MEEVTHGKSGRVPKGTLDLLCLPETALIGERIQVCYRDQLDGYVGYVFPTSEDIKPVLEEPQTGPTSLFTRELSQKLGCYVVSGFPERLNQDEEQPGRLVGANSAIMYDPNGEYVGGYRKTNLFVADLPWAKPGTAT
jgi:protein N-terminal amidase